MAVQIPSLFSTHALTTAQQNRLQPGGGGQPVVVPDSYLSIGVTDQPTALILKLATEKINEMFAPHLGEGAITIAVESGLDMSPEATAERILSFASQIIGRTESQQMALPDVEQRSRDQLFENVRVGVERGFEQAREILDAMQALKGDVKASVDETYLLVEQGLSELAVALGLTGKNQQA